jgi:hypothetical protein
MGTTAKEASVDEILNRYRQFYQNEAFVKGQIVSGSSL